MTAGPEPRISPPTPGHEVRLAIATIAIFLGGLGTAAGTAMFIIGLIRATIGANEGGAMQAGGGMVLLIVALPVLAVGLLLRRRGTAPPNQPGA